MAKIKNPRYKGDGRKTARHFSGGGMLVGPSHEQGGIDALVDGTEPIEVEGGEFIINKQTVDAVGEDFLHKLNSTQTSHHTGGFNEGQLPSPSQYASGGTVTRRNNMARGRRAPGRKTGRAPARRMARGGRTTVRKTASKMSRGVRRMAAGGTMACGGPGQSPCGSGARRGYRRGGSTKRTKPITTRRISNRRGGGRTFAHGGSTHVNSACTQFSGDQTSCQNTSGCNWNFSTDMCH